MDMEQVDRSAGRQVPGIPVSRSITQHICWSAGRQVCWSIGRQVNRYAIQQVDRYADQQVDRYADQQVDKWKQISRSKKHQNDGFSTCLFVSI